MAFGYNLVWSGEYANLRTDPLTPKSRLVLIDPCCSLRIVLEVLSFNVAVHDFTKKVSVAKPLPLLYCFFEQKATNVGLVIGQDLPLEFVVGESLAPLNSHDKEGLALDHFGINKCEDDNDNHYHYVIDQVKKMAESVKLLSENDVLVLQKRRRISPITRKVQHHHGRFVQSQWAAMGKSFAEDL
ncbi:hypothetical protein LZ30DRAFT_693147 [Colletotrichum cereale]|nr:hypothetical protein LZ30DRAFT_693147 [Colletotrichum cereale]